MERKPKPSKTPTQNRQDTLGVVNVGERHDRVVSVSGQGAIPGKARSHLGLEPFVQHMVQENIRKAGRYQPSHNLAKLSFDLSVRLPRAQLRPAYGEGFLGAPVVICPRSGESRSGCGGADDPARRDGSEFEGPGQP